MLSEASLSSTDFLAVLELDQPALELVHRLDFEGVCPACGAVAHLHFDYEFVVVDEHDAIGSALAHTCRSCHSSTARSFIARPDLTDADICKVLELRVPS